MYQPYVPYPSSAPQPKPPVPSTVRRAVIAMYVGAGASLIGIVIGSLMLNTLKRQVLHQIRRGPNMTVQDYANLQHTVSDFISSFGIAFIVTSGLIGAGLWLWMAWKCKQGRSWARIVSTVLFGINTISALSELANVRGAALWNIVTWLIGLTAIILLWQRPSSDYFRAAPRY